MRIKCASFVLILSLPAGLFLWLGLRFPGFTSTLFYQVKDSGLRESGNLLQFLSYWVPHADALEQVGESGLFTVSADRATDDFLEAQRLFHLGDFRGAASLFSNVVEDHGESEQHLFWLGVANMRLAEAINCLGALTERTPPPTTPLITKDTQAKLGALFRSSSSIPTGRPPWPLLKYSSGCWITMIRRTLSNAGY